MSDKGEFDMGIGDKASEMADKAKAKAMDALKNDDNVDKAAQKADEKTEGKHSDQIDKGRDMLKDRMGDDRS
jgi:hypothetical protein